MRIPYSARLCYMIYQLVYCDLCLLFPSKVTFIIKHLYSLLLQMLMSASIVMETVPMIVSIQKLVIIVSALLDIFFKLTSMIVKVNEYIAVA